jgi:5,10-methylenetetrahydrofolate reductase
MNKPEPMVTTTYEDYQTLKDGIEHLRSLQKRLMKAVKYDKETKEFAILLPAEEVKKIIQEWYNE